MNQPYSRKLHILAVITAAMAFPLIVMGGYVTSTGAGLSVEDWPTSKGHNMFLLPWDIWKLPGIFQEHTHRLLGSGVGMLAIALCIAAWVVEGKRRTWIAWLATIALLAIIVQGILGGLRVELKNLDMAIVHGCMAQAVFSLLGVIAVVTSRFWVQSPYDFDTPREARGRSVVRWGVVAILIIYLQLIVGAVMRHEKAGLAIPDFPLSYGKLLPPANATELAAVNMDRMLTPGLSEVTLTQVWLHFGHRIGAVCVTIVLSILLTKILRNRENPPELRKLAWSILGLLILQITLGIITVLWQLPPDTATAHVANGALILMSTVVLTVRAWRLFLLPAPNNLFEVIPTRQSVGIAS